MKHINYYLKNLGIGVLGCGAAIAMAFLLLGKGILGLEITEVTFKGDDE